MKISRKLIVQLVLLASLCVATVELAFCRVYDPDLYQTVTRPARQAAAAVAQWHRQTVDASRSMIIAAGSGVSRAARALSDAIAQMFAPDPPPELFPEEVQLAGDPVLTLTAEAVDPAVTQLKEENGQPVLVGSGPSTVYFNQGEEPWASQLYGRDPIDRYGCGPTAMAMVVSTLGDDIVNPAEMASWAAGEGYWCPGSGSYHTLIEGAAVSFGLEGSSMTDHSYHAIQSALLSGKLVVALMGPGHFTSKGHFIVLRGVTLSGEVLVADPNSVERSLVAWDPEVILSELSSSTSGGAPLWVISRPDEG